MKRFKEVFFAAIALGALTLTLTLTSTGQAIAQGMKPMLVQIINTATNPVPVVPVISAADRVQLEIGSDPACNGSSRSFRRIFADGSVEQPFAVPAGKVLIITDLQGTVRRFADNMFPAGRIASLVVSVGTEPDQPRFAARAAITADAESSGIITVEAHSETGIAGGSNGLLCAGAAVLSHGGVNLASVDRASVQGFLIPE